MSETTGVEVTRDEARRIAVRAQLLDGSAKGVLETVRRLRYLQLDPISTVAPPQHLVLFSRLGSAYDRAELDRLLWEERKLIEWRAFLYPAEDLPYLRARMRRRSPRGLEYIKENAAFRRYVLRELDRRGPLLSREIETHSSMNLDRHDWWGTRKVGLMLEVLAARGEVAVVGRRGKQRVWDLAKRWYPESETVTWAQAEKHADGPPLARARRRARQAQGQLARASRRDRRPGAGPRHAPLPLRPVDPRPRPDRGALGLLLPARDVRAEGEARARLLRPAPARRRPARGQSRARLRRASPRRCACSAPGGRPIASPRPSTTSRPGSGRSASKADRLPSKAAGTSPPS